MSVVWGQRGFLLLVVGVAVAGCGSAVLRSDAGAGGGAADAGDDHPTGSGGTTGGGGTTGDGGTTGGGGSTGGGGTGGVVACGNVTCASGQVCCNASCGTCTPPGGICTTQVCTGGTTGSGRGGSGGAGGTTGSGGTGGSIPACTSTTATSPPMTAANYCAILFNGCTPATAGASFTNPYANMAACVTGYTALSETTRTCRSYHLCNAVGAGPESTHCAHAVGVGLCP